MGVKQVNELRVWQQGKELANAISALANLDPLRRDLLFVTSAREPQFLSWPTSRRASHKAPIAASRGIS